MSNCAICLEENSTMKTSMCQCNAYYHIKCYDTMIKNNNIYCAYCRLKIIDQTNEHKINNNRFHILNRIDFDYFIISIPMIFMNRNLNIYKFICFFIFSIFITFTYIIPRIVITYLIEEYGTLVISTFGIFMFITLIYLTTSISLDNLINL